MYDLVDFVGIVVSVRMREKKRTKKEEENPVGEISPVVSTVRLKVGRNPEKNFNQLILTLCFTIIILLFSKTLVRFGSFFPLPFFYICIFIHFFVSKNKRKQRKTK